MRPGTMTLYNNVKKTKVISKILKNPYLDSNFEFKKFGAKIIFNFFLFLNIIMI